MQITVYGATGTFGRRLVAHLRERGHSVIAAHRGIGVDTYSGEGVTEAAVGSEVLVDCVNHMTNNRHKALDFFSRSSRSIALAAAENPGAAMVCLSIAFKPEVAQSKLLGYYQAKDLQERVYRRLVPADQLLMFRSTQWFELVDSMTLAVGPVAFVPKLRVQALAAGAGSEVGVGPCTSVGSRTRGIPKIVPIPIPGPLSDNGLIPDVPRLSTVTVEDWLRSRRQG